MGPAEAEALGPVVAVPLCHALAAASSARAWILFALVRLAQFSSCHQQLLDAGLVDQLATSTPEQGEGETGTNGRAGWGFEADWGCFELVLNLEMPSNFSNCSVFLILVVGRVSGIWFCFNLASQLGASQRNGQTCWPTTSWPLYLRQVAAKWLSWCPCRPSMSLTAAICFSLGETVGPTHARTHTHTDIDI